MMTIWHNFRALIALSKLFPYYSYVVSLHSYWELERTTQEYMGPQQEHNSQEWQADF